MKKWFVILVLCFLGYYITGFNEKFLWIIYGTTVPLVITFLFIKKSKKGINFTKKFIQTNSKEEILKQSFTKAKEDYNALQNLKSQIIDDEIMCRLEELQQTAEKILKYLNQNPERIPVAEEFIEIYQDKAVTLMQQYLILEKTHFSCSEMSEVKSRINKILSSLYTTYNAEFKRILSHQFINLNAELDVFQNFINEQPKTEPYQETTQICQEKKKSFSKEDSLLRRIKFNQKIMRGNKKIETYEDLFLWLPIGSIVLFWAGLFQDHEITTLYAVIDMLIMLGAFFLQPTIWWAWTEKEMPRLRVLSIVYTTIFLLNFHFFLPEGCFPLFIIVAFVAYIICLLPDT